MLVSSIILGISIVGIVGLLVYKATSKNVAQNSFRDIEDLELEEKLNLLKEEALDGIAKVGESLGKNLNLAYNRGLSNMKSSRIGETVRGRGVLKKKETSSNFLKDVTEHKEKIREELNGDSHTTE